MFCSHAKHAGGTSTEEYLCVSQRWLTNQWNSLWTGWWSFSTQLPVLIAVKQVNRWHFQQQPSRWPILTLYIGQRSANTLGLWLFLNLFAPPPFNSLYHLQTQLPSFCISPLPEPDIDWLPTEFLTQHISLLFVCLYEAYVWARWHWLVCSTDLI